MEVSCERLVRDRGPDEPGLCAGAGLVVMCTHLVPDLPMCQVFLHLESLECSLLHHTLQESTHRPLAEVVLPGSPKGAHQPWGATSA